MEPPTRSPAPAGHLEPGEATRRALLDAAERHFAEHGYAATSLRRVTAAAGANLAAVHYHFGSKDGLLRAVVHRRVEPVNRRRLVRLDALVAEAAPAPPSLEAVLDALLRPVLALRHEPGGEHFVRLAGRLLSEPGGHLAALRGEFETVRARFVPHLARLLPHLSPPALSLRLQLTVGAMSALLAHGDRLPQVCMPGAIDDPDRSVDELVAFCAAGLRAPSTAHPDEEPRP